MYVEFGSVHVIKSSMKPLQSHEVAEHVGVGGRIWGQVYRDRCGAVCLRVKVGRWRHCERQPAPHEIQHSSFPILKLILLETW
jgi:hypothetical protein